jgi:hypothetical protein
MTATPPINVATGGLTLKWTNGPEIFASILSS